MKVNLDTEGGGVEGVVSWGARRCVGHFALAWARRLRDNCKKAIQSLRDLASTTRFTSASVERKHLLGQETHFAKMRGRRRKPARLSAKTYAKSIRESHRRVKILAETMVVGKQNFRAFSRSLGGY